MTNKVTYDISNEELIELYKDDTSRFEGKFRDLESITRICEGYFNGPGQIDKHKIKKGDAELFVNRIFVSVETMVSIVTSQTPPPWVSVTSSNSKLSARKLQNKVERRFRDLWEIEFNGQKKCESSLRNLYSSRFAIARYCDFDHPDNLGFKPIRVNNIRFDTDVLDIQDSNFIAEKIESTVEKMVMRYPDHADLFNGKPRDRVNYWRYWTKYYDGNIRRVMYADIYNNRVLDRRKNPYWNTRGNNHFNREQFPYAFFNTIQDNSSLIDSTSATENAIPLQDALNARKRQIHRNAWMANGLIVALARVLKKNEFDQIDASTDKILLGGDVQRVSDAFTKMTGRSLESGIYEDMYDTKREIDNVYGAHETTRGERGGIETAKGRAILRDADFGRQDLTGRSYEQFVEDIYNGWLQVMYTKGTGTKYIITPSEPESLDDQKKMDSSMSSIDIDKLDVKDLKKYIIKVIVKKGSTRPKDPESMRELAMTLRQVGMMNPLTFFELIGVENPRKHSRREFLWNTDPASLFTELGGPDMVDPDAISHIMDMISNVAGAEDNIMETDDLDKLNKHVQTHGLYMNNLEIDEDLPLYEELDGNMRATINAHVELETEILEKMLQAEQSKIQMGAQGQADMLQGGAMMPDNQGDPIAAAISGGGMA